MQETWRWFGPKDPVLLQQIVQAGASGIVTALHEVPTGETWPLAAILQRKAEIEAHGMNWAVVESVPLHNDIKLRTGDWRRQIENYCQTLLNLGAAGIDTVCYNFMPVVDWTRTNLRYTLPNTALALRFEMTDFVAYDVFLLDRANARDDYSAELLAVAERRYAAMSETEKALLEKNIIAGLARVPIPATAFAWPSATLRLWESKAIGRTCSPFCGTLCPVLNRPASTCVSIRTTRPFPCLVCRGWCLLPWTQAQSSRQCPAPTTA